MKKSSFAVWFALLVLLLAQLACSDLEDLEDPDDTGGSGNDVTEVAPDDDDGDAGDDDVDAGDDDTDAGDDDTDAGDDDGASGSCDPADDTLRLEELGSDEELSLTLEEGDISLVLVALTDDPEETVALLTLTDPNGEVLYERAAADDEEFASPLTNATFEGNGEMSLVLPTTPDYPLQAGEYQFTVGTLNGDAFNAYALIRSGEADCPQVMDLNLWMLSEDGDISDAENYEEVEAQLREAFEAVLGRYDLALGTVNFIEASAEEQATYAQVSEEGMGEACIELYEKVGDESRALNVLVVDALVEEGAEDSDYFTFGISPAPGTLAVADSPNSCALAAWEAHEGDLTEMGMTIVHEGSHFIGLQHTTEEDGQLFDILSDTAECTAEDYDADGDDTVDADECADADGENYIFWGPNSGATGMTADQAWVLRRHPLFHPAP